jgi:hypothetical protein
MDISTDLDLIGGVMGTDKSSAGHNYLVHYDRLLKDLRSEAFNFIEIGIFKGASLATWRAYFGRATVVGVDIHESCREYAKDGVIVEIGSQDDPEFLSGLTRRYPPRVVIDDGSHQAHHIVFTFETLFPALEPGGIYIVEDLHFHVGAMRDLHCGPTKVNPIDYFLSLSQTLAANELQPEARWGFQGYAHRSIDEIIFFGRAVAIRKKTQSPDNSHRLDAVFQIAEQMGTADAWERAAIFFTGNGDRAGAISALRRAISLDPNGAMLHRRISELYSGQRNFEEAMRQAEEAVSVAGNTHDRAACLEQMGDVMVAVGRYAACIELYREAAEIIGHPVVRARIEEKIARWDTSGLPA